MPDPQKHTISHPYERDMWCLLWKFVINWPRYNGTALFTFATMNHSHYVILLQYTCVTNSESPLQMKWFDQVGYYGSCVARSSAPMSWTYHGYAMREVLINSTSLYETNSFSIKGFDCLFSHYSRIYGFLPKETKCVLPRHLWKNK